VTAVPAFRGAVGGAPWSEDPRINCRDIVCFARMHARGPALLGAIK
jgi:hypothetical protein